MEINKNIYDRLFVFIFLLNFRLSPCLAFSSVLTTMTRYFMFSFFFEFFSLALDTTKCEGRRKWMSWVLRHVEKRQNKKNVSTAPFHNSRKNYEKWFIFCSMSRWRNTTIRCQELEYMSTSSTSPHINIVIIPKMETQIYSFSYQRNCKDEKNSFHTFEIW